MKDWRSWSNGQSQTRVHPWEWTHLFSSQFSSFHQNIIKMFYVNSQIPQHISLKKKLYCARCRSDFGIGGDITADNRQKAYGCNYNISQSLKWVAVFVSSEKDSFTCLPVYPHRDILVRFIIWSHFASDFSFCWLLSFDCLTTQKRK